MTVIRFHGRENTIKQWATELGIPYPTLVCRLKNPRWSITKALSTPRQPVKKHGLSTSPIYKIWWAMLDRCYNPKSESYQNYGGRGIRVCSRWMNAERFVCDMVKGKQKGLTIERIDNDKGYSPENCKWATRAEQVRNTRGNVKITFRGRTMVLSDWAKEIGISHSTLAWRLRAWTVEEALTRKQGNQGRRHP